MATPPQVRRASEQQIIDMAYPVLNSGLPPNQLVPRPATLAKNLQYTTQLASQLEEKNPETQSVVEFCASLTEEQRIKVKGCK
jgi:formate dehydrogenase maturation protein FdhE